jgi:hypothetical protein
MMFIIRSRGEWPDRPDIEVKLSRDTPGPIPDGADQSDFFCTGEPEVIPALCAAGWAVVELHDGYYEDGRGGGVAIWGQGKYWEIRDTPFTVKEACGPGGTGSQRLREDEHVEVRRAIFGA